MSGSSRCATGTLGRLGVRAFVIADDWRLVLEFQQRHVPGANAYSG